MYSAVIIICLCVVGYCQDVSEESSDEIYLTESEKKISDSIAVFLEHFKQPDPVGIPGIEIPEPYTVPDMKHSLAIGATLYLKNISVYGISQFRILHVNAEMGTMKVQAAMAIDHLQFTGNYSMLMFWSRSPTELNPFTADVTGLIANATASLGVESDGKLKAQEITIDMSISTIAVNFENLGVVGSIVQGLINTAGSTIFDAIKPYILKEIYTKARAEINSMLKEFAGDMQFPNSISPLDMIIADIRKVLLDFGLDPYKVNDYYTTVGLFSVYLENTSIMGVSTIQRVGNITLKMENKAAIVDFEIGTQKLEGKTQWEISAAYGLISKTGVASFSVEHITGRFVLGQPLDTSKKMVFMDLNIDIGNIKVRCDGAGTIDYAIESLINIFPNLLRYQIIDGIEKPLKEKIQQELNYINTEELIKAKLPKIIAMKENGFNLSSIKNTNGVEEPLVEDEFFNF